jgi:hypothetical protein
MRFELRDTRQKFISRLAKNPRGSGQTIRAPAEHVIRKRCISRPTEHQAILLQHLNLHLPNSLEMAQV